MFLCVVQVCVYFVWDSAVQNCASQPLILVEGLQLLFVCKPRSCGLSLGPLVSPTRVGSGVQDCAHKPFGWEEARAQKPTVSLVST